MIAKFDDARLSAGTEYLVGTGAKAGTAFTMNVSQGALSERIDIYYKSLCHLN
jgi:hypothetical protein